MKYYLTFDAGTQSIKVAIYDQNFNCVATSSKPTTLYYPQPEWVQMNVDEYLTHIKVCIIDCLQQLNAQDIDPQAIAAIMGDGIICGVVGINAQGQAITPYINYLDSRTKDDAQALNSQGHTIWQQQTGNPEPLCMFPALHARWLQKNSPDFQQDGVKFVHNAPYILMHMAGLSGEQAFIDWGTMSGWGLGYNVYTKEWSPEQLEILELDARYMPRIVKPWEIVGHLSAEFAAATGLPIGIPICAGAGDTMQSMLGSGIFEAGRAVDVAGTCAMFCISTDGIVPELSQAGNGLIFNSGTLPDTYFYWGFVRTGGLALRWFRDNICLQAGNDGYYGALSTNAQNIPAGANGVLFLPYLTGEYGDSSVRGCFLNMTLDTDQATLWRSVLEAIAYDYKKVTDICRRANLSFESITVTEGGSRDPLWNQIKADVLNIKTATYQAAGGALLMNAITAAYALQDIDSLKSCVQNELRPLAEFVPNPANTAIYDKQSRQQQLLVKRLQD